jgi:putative DNA methylase
MTKADAAIPLDFPAPPNAAGDGTTRSVSGTALSFDSLDRPKTCLEVDFPIVPINKLAQLEVNSKKPIYEMGKWWARRQSSVFRSLLIAAATPAPADPNEADRRVWDAYYRNHQAAGSFRGLRVLDPFMGGGTTLVEGNRLGFDVAGVDLNPIAWFVTKTELSSVDPTAVQAIFDDVERKVRPQVTPYTVTTCPRGHPGTWYLTDRPDTPFDLKVARKLGRNVIPQETSFDPLTVPLGRRTFYRYDGPEVVYTFWAKHGPCVRCGHRTPVLRSPVVATKTLTVRFVRAECPHCRAQFDWELDDARMAPNEKLVVCADDASFVSPGSGVDDTHCPACAGPVRRPPANKPNQKSVSLTLLLHPRWLAGCAGNDGAGNLGGGAGAPLDDERRWIERRAEGLAFVEVRGDLPRRIQDPFDPSGRTTIETGRGTAKQVVRRDKEGNLRQISEDSTFVCGNCGLGQDFLTAVKPTGNTAPAFPYLIQGFCPTCADERRPYGGRFFKAPDREDCTRWLSAVADWEVLRGDMLGTTVPSESLPFAHMTHDLNGGIPNWGYTHWWKMFNPRQLLTHARLLEAIQDATERHGQPAAEAALNAFQQYLRNQNMFCFWNVPADKMEPFFSNNNYHPKATVIENGCFTRLGRGNWESCTTAVLDGLTWARKPWEKAEAAENAKAKSVPVPMNDPVDPARVIDLNVGSATDLAYADRSFDLVITDPPFGDNIFYADLADFFYVWLRKPLRQWYPDVFATSETNKVQEAITNPAEHPAENPDTVTAEDKRLARETPADEFYRETLTACWAESARVLKDSGLLAFTFHHSQGRAWETVLRSLFDAGFVLESTYPIRGDETKGKDAAFGSRKIEYDIIHVCRKRLDAPKRLDWVRMRRSVRDELLRLRGLLEHYRAQQLSEEDIRVVLRGKALEFYSRHYGEVYVGDGEEPMTIGAALLGINALLDEDQLSTGERLPDTPEPLTWYYLRVFNGRRSLNRDDLHKLLLSTGASPAQFYERGWIEEDNKVVSAVSPQTRFQAMRKRRRDAIKSDLDQAHFLIGAAVEKSGVSISDELRRGTFLLKAAVPDILRWYRDGEPDKTLREAAGRALGLVEVWLSEHADKPKDDQLALGI